MLSTLIVLQFDISFLSFKTTILIVTLEYGIEKAAINERDEFVGKLRSISP